jgi:hypothetical protein
MSQESIKYILKSKFDSYSELKFYFDFLDEDLKQNYISSTGDGIDWTGFLQNQSPYIQAEDFYGVALEASGSSGAEAESLLYDLIGQDGFDLSASNIKIPTKDIDLTDCSFIIDFSFIGNIESGIMFGSFEKDQIQLPDLSFVTETKGFNVGVTDRGHLFINGHSGRGDFVKVFEEIELSKRNVISFGNKNSKFYIEYFDFFNNSSKKIQVPLGNAYSQSPEYFFIGGTKNTFKTENEKNTTLNANLNSIYGFSRKISNCFDLYKGFSSDYFLDEGEGSVIIEEYFSGDYPIYAIGISGYEQVLNTGVEYTKATDVTVNYTNVGAELVKEGSEYSTLIDGSIVKKGYLDPTINNIYAPTGTNAEATKGLLNLQGGIDVYESEIIETEHTGEYEYFVSEPVTGELDWILYTDKIYGEREIVVEGIDESGVYAFQIEAEDFKKNFIYYKGER